MEYPLISGCVSWTGCDYNPDVNSIDSSVPSNGGRAVAFVLGKFSFLAVSFINTMRLSTSFGSVLLNVHTVMALLLPRTIMANSKIVSPC